MLMDDCSIFPYHKALSQRYLHQKGVILGRVPYSKLESSILEYWVQAEVNWREFFGWEKSFRGLPWMTLPG